MSKIPTEDRLDSTIAKVLGLVWDSMQDTLAITDHFSLNLPIATTKRQALSALSKIFDPTGLFCPCLRSAKLFIQSLWRQKDVKWDTPLPQGLAVQWRLIEEEIRKLPGTPVQRFTGLHDTEDPTYDLIAFCDSSQKAFGIAI